jgi:hypothetical protein
MAFLTTSAFGTVWEIDANNDWINAIKDSLVAGDTVMFATDGGSYMTPGSGYIPSKELTLMAKPGLANKPILSTNDGGYIGKVNANLTVIGLAFDGLWINAAGDTNSSATYRMFQLNKNVDRLIVKDCDFSNIRGEGLCDKVTDYVLDTLIVDNCTFSTMGSNPIHYKETSGTVGKVTITNSSFWDINNHAIYVKATGDVVEVSNCTFADIDQRGVYPLSQANGLIIKDNIFTGCGTEAVKAYGTGVDVSYNLFWGNVVDIDSTNATNVDTTGKVNADPQFKKTSAEDYFALNISSPAVGTASDGGNMGDPSWGTFDPTTITLWEIDASNDWITAIKYFVAAGDTVMFVTDGGSYMTPGSGYIPSMELVLMAKPGLTSKPVLSTNDGGYIGKVNANLTVIGLAFDGQWISAAGDTNSSSTYRMLMLNKNVDRLIVKDCDFYNIRGEGLCDKLTTVVLDTLIVDNCTFSTMGSNPIHYKEVAGTVGKVDITNSSFWDINNHAIYVKAAGDVVKVTNCTFADIDQRGVYPLSQANGLVIKDNIFAGCGTEAVKAYGTGIDVSYNLFWDNVVDIDSTNATGVLVTGNVVGDPVFEDTLLVSISLALGKFTSAALNVASDGGNMGDPRWGTFNEYAGQTRWEITENATDWYTPIKDYLTSNDTIMFVTDGGEYVAPSNISLRKLPLVLMAAPGLSEKPVLKNATSNARIIKFYRPLVVKGLKFEGDYDFDAGIPYGLYWDTSENDYGNTIFEDCEFAGFKLRALHMQNNNWTDTLIVNNCLFRELGETGIYTSSTTTSTIGVAKITNCTFYKIGQKGIYLRQPTEVQVSHCTFAYNDASINGKTGNVGINTPGADSTVIRDNIFVKQDVYGVRVYGSNPVVEYNLFWECDTIIKSEDRPELTFPTFNFVDDPLFADTSSANLDLALDAENSSAVGNASDGVSNLGDPNWGTFVVSGVADGDLLPMVYALHQNYPNPFNPSTTIKFDVVDMGHVSLVVYDLLGREIVNLVDQTLEPGFHTIAWNANRLASGIYFYRITVNDFTRSRKLVVLK